MGDLIDITMNDVLNRVNITIIKTRGNELNCLCPYCDKDRTREGHLYINIVKNTFICHKCGIHGNALQLYALLKNQTTKEAYKELAMEISTGRKIIPKTNQSQPPFEQKQNIAPPEIRDKTYREFLKLLNLDEKHKKDLLKRGLSEKVIQMNNYKTLNADKETRLLICKKLLQKGVSLDGIPGFFRHKTNGSWDFIPYKGYAIPVKNLQGYIVGLQVRMDEPALSKYRWFSSSNSNEGTPAQSNLHLTGTFDNNIVFVTEGILKADVASYLLEGKMFIGLPGISSCHKQLIETLQVIKPKLVVLAFDMDYKEKKEVAYNVQKIKNLLNEQDFKFKQIEWDNNYKGIDDFLLFLKQTKGA